MPQLYAQLASRPSPWLLGRTSAGLCTLQTACPLTVTYSGGSADTIAAATGATVYGGSATAFDASADVWVVLTVQGSGALQVVKEADLATVTSDWAGLARIAQHATEPYQPQAYLASGGAGSGTTSSEYELPLAVTTVDAVGGSLLAPVPDTGTDYVVTLHLVGAQAAAVWAVLSDTSQFSDVKILYGGVEIACNTDAETYGAWGTSSIAIDFRLQRPIASSSTDLAYRLRVGGGVRSAPPRAWANIYPLADDFLAWRTALWGTQPGWVSLSGSVASLTASAASGDHALQSVPAYGAGYAAAVRCTLPGLGAPDNDEAGVGFNPPGSDPFLDAQVSSFDHVGDVTLRSKVGASDLYTTLMAQDGSSHVYLVARRPDGTLDGSVDGGTAVHIGGNSTAASAPAMLHVYSNPGPAGTTVLLGVDWVRVRPYVHPEPTVSAGALAPVGGAPLVAPGGPAAEGDLLYYHAGAWADLPIGTTGQELTVVSGDPAWTDQPADSDYTDPLSTKGDLLTRSSSATVRLGVGSNGQVVTADSTAADGIKWATPATGGVTSIDVAVPAPLSSAGGPITSSGTITLSWASGQTANRVLASPDGTTGAVGLRALVAADIPSLPASQITSGQLAAARGGTGLDGSGVTDGQLLIGQSSDHSFGLATLTAGSGVTITNAGHGITIAASSGSGTVTSATLSVPSIFSVSPATITTSGTFAVTLANENAATVFAGPASGSAAVPTFRALQGSDLPTAAGAGGHIHAHGHFL